MGEGRGRFYDLEFAPGASLPILEQSIHVPGLGKRTVARLAIAPVADYFAFPGHHELTQAGHARTVIEQCPADIICFSNLIESSPLTRAFAHTQRSDWVAAQPTLGIDCRGVFDDYVASRPRLIRRIHARSDALADRGCLDLRPCSPRDLDWLLELQAARATARGYDALRDDLTMRAFLEGLVASGERGSGRTPGLLLAEYSVDGEPVSGLLVLDDGAVWSVYLQGFAERHAELSPSMANILRLVQAAHEQAVPYVDLLRGDEVYKRRLTTTRVPLLKYVHARRRADREAAVAFVRGWKE